LLISFAAMVLFLSLFPLVTLAEGEGYVTASPEGEGIMRSAGREREAEATNDVSEKWISRILARSQYEWREYSKRAQELLTEAGLIHDPIERVERFREIVSCYPHTPAAEEAEVLLRGLIAAQKYEREVNVGICTWKGNKRAAVTLTYDDAVPNQIKYHVPLMEERGFRGTFFVFANAISRGQSNNWEPWVRIAEKGHEIGSHTLSHPRLTELSEEEIERELSESKRIIGEHIGEDPLTFAYPYAQHDPRVRRIAKSHYISARAGGATVAPPTPLDLYDVPSFVPATKTTLEEMNSWVDAALETGGWMVEMIHGIEGKGWQPIPRERFAAHFDYMAERKDELWVATYSEVVKYIRERLPVAVNTKEVQRDRVVLELMNSGLDDAVYDEALTLRLEVPFYWETVTVVQGGSAADEVECVEEGQRRVVHFDAVPNLGDIVVEVVEKRSPPGGPREEE